MAKKQGFVVGSTNPVTATKTDAQLKTAWNKLEVLKAGDLDGVFKSVSTYSQDSSEEIANAINILTGSQPTGASTSELGNAINNALEEIKTTSLSFKGFVSSTQPSSSTYTFKEGNIWINSATMPTTFPVAASSIRVWDGTSWATTTDTYTAADFDFFRNVNDSEGYYWFAGEWVIMSTDMSTTYFVLDSTGKWAIKSNVTLPGTPSVGTSPSANDDSTKIATTEWVNDKVSDATITITQGSVQKGSFTLNQSSNSTIDLDQGGLLSVGFSQITGQPSENTNLNTALLAKQDKLPTLEANKFLTNNGSILSWGAGITPTGTITAFGGSSAPDGWLICNGGAISRTTYSALFAVIGTTYGSGDGSTTFNLPNCSGLSNSWSLSTTSGFGDGTSQPISGYNGTTKDCDWVRIQTNASGAGGAATTLFYNNSGGAYPAYQGGLRYLGLHLSVLKINKTSYSTAIIKY